MAIFCDKCKKEGKETPANRVEVEVGIITPNYGKKEGGYIDLCEEHHQGLVAMIVAYLGEKLMC